MTIVTHALATTLGVRVLKLTGSDAVLAYVFGVGVDIDHAIKLPFFWKAGLRKERGYYWRWTTASGTKKCRGIRIHRSSRRGLWSAFPTKRRKPFSLWSSYV